MGKADHRWDGAGPLNKQARAALLVGLAVGLVTLGPHADAQTDRKATATAKSQKAGTPKPAGKSAAEKSAVRR